MPHPLGPLGASCDQCMLNGLGNANALSQVDTLVGLINCKIHGCVFLPKKKKIVPHDRSDMCTILPPPRSSGCVLPEGSLP